MTVKTKQIKQRVRGLLKSELVCEQNMKIHFDEKEKEFQRQRRRFKRLCRQKKSLTRSLKIKRSNLTHLFNNMISKETDNCDKKVALTFLTRKQLQVYTWEPARMHGGCIAEEGQIADEIQTPLTEEGRIELYGCSTNLYVTPIFKKHLSHVKNDDTVRTVFLGLSNYKLDENIAMDIIPSLSKVFACGIKTVKENRSLLFVNQAVMSTLPTKTRGECQRLINQL